MQGYSKNQAFIKDIIDSNLLDLAIGWIQNNLDPSDVFNEAELKHWANQNNSPEDIFTNTELVDWAESNGYYKE